MKSQILFLVMGLAVGALAVAVVRSSSPSDDAVENAELAAAEARIAALEAEKARTLAEAEKVKPKAETGGLDFGLGEGADENAVAALDDAGDEAAEGDVASQFAKILNSKEARSLMKQFSGAAVNVMEDRAESEIAKYKEQLGLTDAQAEALKVRLTAKLKEETDKFASSLDDDSRTMEEIMQEQGENWRNQEDDIAAIMREELTEDQYSEFEREMLAERAKRVETRATWQLNRLDSKLDLDEGQKDQVFGILVENSPDYDPSMSVEGATVASKPKAVEAPATVPADTADASGAAIGAGVGAEAGALLGGKIPAEVPAGIDASAVGAAAEGVDAGAVNAQLSQEDAIRGVLTPEQVEIYNKSLEEPGGGGGNPWAGFGFGR